MSAKHTPAARGCRNWKEHEMTNTITLPRSVVEQALEALDEIAWSKA